MHYKSVRFAAALAAVMLAAGCEHTLLEDTIFDSEYVARHLPNEEKVLSATMFTPRPTAVVQTIATPPSTKSSVMPARS
jgi:hypothetical protein